MAKSEVVKRLQNAWEMLSDRIDRAHKEFLKDADEEDLAESHFICWEEADVPFQLGRFFYSEKDDGKYEFHLEMNLKSKNFEGYEFSDNGNLSKVQEKLGKNARIDFLVAGPTNDIFPVCGEAKYFRYPIEGISRGTRTITDAIEEDFEKLRTFLKYEVCQNTVYAVLDKYYHRFDAKSWDKAKLLFEKMEDSGITVFMKEV
ncbi:MAG: hypothetical protein M1166_02495 [Candidatus Thermoplasmatota archaeon]|jgi:hypothetical protein|nr:hypothetical protein [Candidatus Thermoplasmatota archaeon]